MLQRRIELCSGRTSSADAALQTAGAAANGQPTGPRAGSRRCKSKAKNPRGFGGQSHPIPSITHERNRELRVRFFGGSTSLAATKPQKALVLGKSLLRLPLPVPNAPPVSLPNSPALLRSNRAKHVRRPGLLISNRFAVKYNRPLASFFHGSVSLGKTHFATA